MVASGEDPVHMQFTDLRYTPKNFKGGRSKEVLHGVNGELQSGRLTAIMGPSGAGKSSLLNVLSAFKTKGVTGSIKVNGVERNVDVFRTQSCYIRQDQALLPQLTARESLMVAANLKLKPGWKKDPATSSVVSDIFELLGLTSTEKTSVKNLSGGQQKRLAIGLELITNPPFMFFDEPTSGLDSSSSVQVISHLRSLSNGGRAVACVIHQPSSRIFQMFDDLYVVTDGRCLYAGSTSNIVKVFESAGFKCPEYYNRADFVIEVACLERGNDLTKLFSKFATSSFYVKREEPQSSAAITPTGATTAPLPRDQKSVSIILDPNQTHTYRQIDATPSAVRKIRKYPTSACTQFWVLLKRAILCMCRDVQLGQIKLASHVVIGLLLGLMYYDIGNDAKKVVSNTACIFFFQMFLFFSYAMPTVMAFPSEMSVFMGEHLNHWYSLPAYYLSKLLSNVPLQVVCPCVFILIGYYLSGQPTETDRILMALLPCQLLVLTAQGLGMVLGAAFDEQIGAFLVPVAMIPVFLFSGFFIRLPDIHRYVRPLAEASYFKHCHEAFMLAVYGYDRENLYCEDPVCNFTDPDTYLKELGMKETRYWINIAGLAVWAVVLHITLYLVLMWRIHKAK